MLLHKPSFLRYPFYMNDIYARTNNICLVFLTIVTGTVALVYMRPMLIPLIFAIFVYAILTPLVRWIRVKTRLPKSLAVLISMGLFTLGLTMIVFIIIQSVENFVEGVPKYKESLNTAIYFVQTQLDRFDVDINLQKIQELVRGLPLFNYAQRLTTQLFSFLGNLFLVFIFTVFMMTGESRSTQKGPFLKEVLHKVSSYVVSKFFLSLATGLLVGIVLLIFQVELAFIFALLTILLNFIPNIGSIVAVLLPLPIVFLQYQFGWVFWVVLALSGLIQFTVGNVIEPKMMGDSMDLHPITVLICLIFWGMVWGIAGMFLAVPITAVLKIIFTKIEATQTLAEILAGRLPER